MKCCFTSVTALLATCALAGCQSYDPESESGWVDPCADIPAGAIPQPAGTFTHRWYSQQAALADHDDFVIYQYEWQGENLLSPFGQRHLEGLADRLISEPEQILIETSGNPELDSSRRDFLVNALASRDVPSAQQRVTVSYPAAEGLHGREAQGVSTGYFGSGRGSTRSGQSSFGGAGGVNSGTGGLGTGGFGL